MFFLREFISLEDLLIRGRERDSVVAFNEKASFSWGDFTSSVASFSEELSKREETRWCLYAESSYKFAVGFFSLLQSGKTIVLPPSGKLGLLEELAGSFSGVISDTELALSGSAKLDLSRANYGSSWQFKRLAPEECRILMFTSGSTGEPKLVSKTLRHLSLEVSALEQVFGERLAKLPVFGTVSHQHIYGLLFRVLWPLAAGLPFYSEIIPYPEELLAKLKLNGRGAVVSSPTQLKRLPELVDLGSFLHAAPLVFSSGGALAEGVSERFFAEAGHAPLEVLGSTETGGIAWRECRDSAESKYWRAFPEVRFNCAEPEGRLLICSSYAGDNPGVEWVEVGDLAEKVSEREFVLRSRIDRIVKVEGKRVSLVELETRLLNHPFVAEARAVFLAENSSFSGRDTIGMLLVLTAAGEEHLREHGARSMALLFRAWLAEYFEAVALPRKYRYLEALPATPEGKLVDSELREYFKTTTSSKNAKAHLPKLQSRKLEGEVVLARASVPEDLWCFDDHFPSHPLVPGYLQLDWVAYLAPELFRKAEEGRKLVAIEAVKFQRMLLPGEEFQLEAKWDAGKSTISFSLSVAGAKCSSGRFRFS